MKCINCGKEAQDFAVTGFGRGVCQSCADALERLRDQVFAGLEIVYSDGSRRTVGTPKPPTVKRLARRKR